MKNIITFSALLTLIACSSSPNNGMLFSNKNPRGISILNVSKDDRVKAYREAEKHCAKYSKVTRIIKNEKQEQPADEEIYRDLSTIIFECLKPSN